MTAVRAVFSYILCCYFGNRSEHVDHKYQLVGCMKDILHFFTSDDSVDGLLKMLNIDEFIQMSSSNESCFITDICNISTWRRENSVPLRSNNTAILWQHL